MQVGTGIAFSVKGLCGPSSGAGTTGSKRRKPPGRILSWKRQEH